MSEEPLAARLAQGVQALKSGRADDAVQHLLAVASSEEFEQADDLDDIRARVFSLTAQALLDAGRASESRAWARQARHLAEAEGDLEGAELIKGLERRIGEALLQTMKDDADRARLIRIADRDLDELLLGVDDPQERRETLLAKANGEVEVGRLDRAGAIATELIAMARGSGDTRTVVLGLLTLARAEPDRAESHLLSAHKAADEADDFNLVAIIVRAAEHAGVTLHTHGGLA